MDGPGWDGTGNGSVDGGTPIQTVTMNSPISMHARWYAEFYLTIDAVNGGFASDVSGWYTYGSTVILQATPPPSALDTRYLSGWSGEGEGAVQLEPSLGNSNIQAVTILGPTTQRSEWATQYKVRIRNSVSFGDPQPSVGDYWVDAGGMFYASVMPNSNGYVCVGYEGTGSIINGALPIFSTIINQPSSAEWLWQEIEDSPLTKWGESQYIAQGFEGRNVKADVSSVNGVYAVAFYSHETRELRCHILYQGEWTEYVVAEGENVGTFMDMKLDSQGNPHIVYYDGINQMVLYGSFEQMAGKPGEGSFTIEVVESGEYGRSMSMVLDSQDRAHVVYYGVEQQNVRYLHKTPGGWVLLPIMSDNDIGFFCDIGLTPLVDVPQVIYFDRTKSYPSSMLFSKTIPAGEVRPFCKAISSPGHSSSRLISRAGRSSVTKNTPTKRRSTTA
ncbi:MAG: hypothetical protein U5N86_08485 [Planctomycetota bacterium]|nr:hypothetical protein [Planctomycetota bacterium]